MPTRIPCRAKCSFPGCDRQRAVLKDGRSRTYESSQCTRHQRPEEPVPPKPVTGFVRPAIV